MKELVKHLAKSLVDYPENVETSENQGAKSVVIELKVDSRDMGKVIGKNGRIAKAIRTVVKAAAAREGKKVVVEIVQ
ncbi:RNA-binding protein (KH domain) [Desulfonispora thiosulfatigenes DSM 11270]|uniref:RNA-binding protein KhpA n=1 Tax=Desulfonispora thiosulfatigenes DSM 11270 TaxID=656914 RepID=A0A1W1VKF1_DESTI|nr:KH domain-containing protein [Desulfonispora thiosulfatigenes]SMB93796.1 RNA-binding protein (KH domain) [Desulfonispora thiosulfatigenes DSM 11270]